jgi:hypothetical protein
MSDKLKHCITENGQIRWHSDEIINWKRQYGRLKVSFRMRKNNGAMGRMGGGWLWKFGIEAARGELLFNLFVAVLRVSWYKP